MMTVLNKRPTVGCAVRTDLRSMVRTAHPTRLKLPGGGRVLAQVDSHHNHAIGERIGIRLGIDHVVAFRK